MDSAYDKDNNMIHTKIRGVKTQKGCIQNRQGLLYVLAQKPELLESIRFEGLDIILVFSRPINGFREYNIGVLDSKYQPYLHSNRLKVKGFKITGADRPYTKENEIENRSVTLGMNLSIELL